MITNISNIQLHEEMIQDNDVLCTTIGSTGPFMSLHDMALSKKGQGHVEENACDIMGKKPAFKTADNFFDGTLKEAEVRSKRMPNSPEILNDLALKYLKAGLIDIALQTIKACLSIRKDYLPALANLAECYTKLGEIDKAITIYTKLKENNNFALKALINLALLSIREKAFEKALNYILEAKKIAPDDPVVLRNLGMIYLIKGNKDLAISFTRKALKRNGGDYQTYNNLGVCYADLGAVEKALKQFKTAYLLNKTARNVIKNITQIYQHLELYDESITILDEYLYNYPDDVELKKALCFSLIKSGQYNRCLKDLKKLLDTVDEGDIEEIAGLHNNLAITYEKLNNNEKSREHFLKCLEVGNTPNIIIFYNIIGFFMHLKNYESAKNIIDIAHKKYPQEALLHYYSAEYYTRMHNYDLARQFYTKTLDLNPNIHQAYLVLSTIEIDVYHNYQAAKELLKKGLALRKDDLALKNNYAYCLIQLGELKEVERILDETDLTNNVYLNATKGLFLLKTDDLEEGRKYYNKAANLAQNNKNLYDLVNQKKLLEIGRYYLEHNNVKEAIKHLKSANKYKAEEQYYIDQVKTLLSKIANG